MLEEEKFHVLQEIGKKPLEAVRNEWADLYDRFSRAEEIH